MTALVLGLILAAPVQEHRVSASLSAYRISVGDVTMLEITVEVAGGAEYAIDLPALPSGLEIVGSQEFTQMQLTVPGGRRRVVRRNVGLLGRAPGVYTIQGVRVTIDGRVHSTPELTVAVAATVDAGPRGSPAGSVRLRVTVDPDTPWVGQQVVLRVEAQFPRNLRQRQTRPTLFEAPSPPGFWVADLGEGVTGGVRVIDGELFETQSYRRAYFPIMAGAFRLPPARIRLELRRGYLYAPEPIELASDSLPVTVRPLPVQGRPPGFAGAVGRYELSARLEPATVGVGDAATLTVEVRGTGNVKALPPPRLPALHGIEVFPPTEESRVVPGDGRVAGTKRFTWVLVPERPGELAIDPVEFAYFDLTRRDYTVLRSAPLLLRVEAAAPVARTSGPDMVIHGARARPSGDRLGWVLTPGFAAAQALPLLGLAGMLLLRRARHGPAARRRRVRRARQAELEALLRPGADLGDRDFLDALAARFRAALADLAGERGMRAAESDGAGRALAARGASGHAAAAAAALLRRLDQGRFAGGEPPAPDRAALVREAGAVLRRLEREMPGRPGGRRFTGTAAVLALIGALGPAATASVAVAGDADGRAAFDEGIAAYRQGDYDGATAAFERFIRHSPRDANGWYNLGNAHHGAGRYGPAVRAWTQALRLAPRHADARNNLAAVRATAAASTAPAPWTPTPAEAALLAAAFWWIAVLAAAAYVWRPTARRRRLALTAAAAVLAAGLAGAAAAARRPAAIILDDGTPMLAGPAHGDTHLSSLAAGLPVRVLAREPQWWRVRTSDAVEGWVEADRLGPLP
jgi:tetratricopeptide (TPR) repeat protein